MNRTIEFDMSWKRGISFRYRETDNRYIETMPVPDEFRIWREGKTEKINNFLEQKERNGRLAKRESNGN